MKIKTLQYLYKAPQCGALFLGGNLLLYRVLIAYFTEVLILYIA